ncbi:MAG: hypothetical protein AAGM21_04170 [Pseudomonadota bacterium]
MRYVLSFLFLIGLGVPATALTVSVTGGFDGNIQFLDSNNPFEFSANDPRLEGWYLDGMLTDSGSMEIYERFVASEPELRVRNCTGLLEALCAWKVWNSFATFDTWDFTFTECLTHCNLDFNLRGYTITTDTDTTVDTWTNQTGTYVFGSGESFAVRFSSVTLDYSEVSAIPLPLSASLLLVGLGSLAAAGSLRKTKRIG